MANIGNIAAKLSLDNSDFVAGVNKADQRLARFDAKANAVKPAALKSPALLANSGLDSFSAGLAKLDAGPASSVLSVFKALPGPIAAATAALGALTVATAAQVNHTEKLARSLGVGFESFQELGAAAGRAGLDEEELYSSLQRVQKTVGEAVSGSSAAASALQVLGLNARELADLPADRQLMKIADALNTVSNRSERAAIMTELFGRAGFRMDQLLQMGSRGMAEMAEKARSYGVIISDADGKTLEMANGSIKELGLAFTGIKNELATGFAPVIKDLADSLKEITGPIRSIMGAYRDLRSEIEGSPVLSAISDLLSLNPLTNPIGSFRSVMATLRGEATEATDSPFASMAAEAARLINSALGQAGGGAAAGTIAGQRAVNDLTKEWDLLAKTIGMSAEQAALFRAEQQGASSEAIAEGVRRLEKLTQQRLTGNIDRTQRTWADQLATMEMTARQAEIYRRAQEGATDAELLGMRALDQAMSYQERMRALRTELESPLERFDRRREQIGRDQQLGIGEDILAREMGQAVDELGRALQTSEDKGPPAIEAGTREAMSAIARFERGGGQQSAQERIRQLMETAAERDQERLAQGREMLEALRRMNLPRTANF